METRHSAAAPNGSIGGSVRSKPFQSTDRLVEVSGVNLLSRFIGGSVTNKPPLQTVDELTQGHETHSHTDGLTDSDFKEIFFVQFM